MKNLSALVRGWQLASLLLLFVLTCPAAFAQVPAWQMAIATGQTGNHYSQVTATTTDASGNVYITGNFVGTASFGNTALTSTGTVSEIFVAKWSPSTNGFVWAQRAGGNSINLVSAIAVAGANVYIAGAVSNNATFGSATNSSPAGPFIAKLTDAGNNTSFTWVERTDFGTSALAVNGTSLYVAGGFYLTATFGNIVLSNGNQLGNSFVAKLNDNGSSASYVWAKQAGGVGYDKITALAVNGSNVYATGYFYSLTATFGSTTLTNASVMGTFSPRCDAFVAKLTDAGATASFTWVQQVSGRGLDLSQALAVNGQSLYIAGYFGTSAASFLGSLGNTPATFGSTALDNIGDYDAFVAKLTDAGSTGSFDWAQRAGGLGADSATAIAVRGNRVYVAGTFNSPQFTFGTTTLPNLPASSGGISFYRREVFVTKLLDAGTTSSFAWAQKAGGIGADFATSIAISGANVYVGGAVGPPASFSSQVITTPAGGPVPFLASLTDPTLLATTPALAGSAFTLAPNPGRSVTTVTLPALPGTATATLTLRDALGRAIRTATVTLPVAGLRHELDLSGLAPGLYAVQVQAGPATATRRLVVE